MEHSKCAKKEKKETQQGSLLLRRCPFERLASGISLFLPPPLTRTHLSLWLPLFDNKPAPRGLGEGEEEEEDRGRRIGGQGIQMAPLRQFYCVLEEARGWCWAE